MKKVLILNPCLYTNGGGEKYMGYFCRFLENTYPDIAIKILVYNVNGMNVADDAYVSIDDLNLRFNLSLQRTSIAKIAGDYGSGLFKNTQLDRKIKKISRDYDLFINWNFLSKQIGNANRNIYFCMFPPKPYVYKNCKLFMRPYRFFTDTKFVQSYNQYLCISEYTQKWLLRYWPGIAQQRCALVYPPVYGLNHLQEEELQKKNIIVSVGRFFLNGHNKKQKEMLQAFLEHSDQLGDYEYHIIGAVSEKKEDHEYLELIETMAKRSERVFLHVNCGLDELKSIYSEAKIFWHSTGYGIEDEQYPEQMEHFGITTVEAMSYGVVPIVINKGGQREIVENGITGFLWNHMDDCIEHTKELIFNDCLRGVMSTQAKKSALRFSVEQFDQRCKEIIQIE